MPACEPWCPLVKAQLKKIVTEAPWVLKKEIPSFDRRLGIAGKGGETELEEEETFVTARSDFKYDEVWRQDGELEGFSNLQPGRYLKEGVVIPDVESDGTSDLSRRRPSRETDGKSATERSEVSGVVHRRTSRETDGKSVTERSEVSGVVHRRTSRETDGKSVTERSEVSGLGHRRPSREKDGRSETERSETTGDVDRRVFHTEPDGKPASLMDSTTGSRAKGSSMKSEGTTISRSKAESGTQWTMDEEGRERLRDKPIKADGVEPDGRRPEDSASKHSERERAERMKRKGKDDGEDERDDIAMFPEECEPSCPRRISRMNRARKLEERQRLVDDYLLNKGWGYFDDICTCSLSCLLRSLKDDSFVRSILASAILFTLGLKLCSELDSWYLPVRSS